MRRLLAKAISRNQLLILPEIQGHNSSISSLLVRIPESYGIPLSSLKLDSRILTGLGLIEIDRVGSNYGASGLSEAGRFVIDVINDK